MLQPYLFIGAISAFWDGVLLHWNIRDKCQLRYQNINANADANAVKNIAPSDVATQMCIRRSDS